MQQYKRIGDFEGVVTSGVGVIRLEENHAKQALGARIEDRYYRRRRHSSIGMISPVRFEQLHLQTAQAT